MKRALLLGAIFVILLPQLLLSDQSLDYCCGRQLGTRNPGLAFASGYVDVSVSQAKQMIDSNPSLVILDVRTLEEYESGHIENATLIPVDELASRLGELDKQRETLVYCLAGGRSAQASQILVDSGFSKVYNMLSGITAWIQAGYWIEIAHDGDLIIDGTQRFVIEDCFYIQAGNIFVRDNGTLVLRNAGIHMLGTLAFSYEILFEDYGILEMKNAFLTSDKPLVINFTQASKASFNNVTIHGDVAFGHINVVLWQSTNITRNYKVIARNMSSNSLGSVELTLLDQHDNIVWRGLTDNQGLANFDITFSDNNYTETLGLKIQRKGFYSVAEQQINFSSSTPISITLIQKPLGDVNEDHVVNILDISLAAVAFGSNPGDPNWNQATDLNEDGVINILDISLIAKEYGTTAQLP